MQKFLKSKGMKKYLRNFLEEFQVIVMFKVSDDIVYARGFLNLQMLELVKF